MFPFTFAGVTFEGCITLTDPDQIPWCSTKVDEEGVHVGSNNNWGHCDLDSCPLSEDPRAKDEVIEEEEDLDYAENEDDEDPLKDEEQPEELTSFRDCETSDGKVGQCKPHSLCTGLTAEEVSLGQYQG